MLSQQPHQQQATAATAAALLQQKDYAMGAVTAVEDFGEKMIDDD